jgi:GH24 family phage-related lysozyme (muramidase)
MRSGKCRPLIPWGLWAKKLWPYQNTQYYAQIAGALGPLLGGTSAGTTTQSNPLGTALGLGTLGYGLLFSDKKLKQDIQPIGKTFDNQTIYKYHYNDDPTPRIGLIAQQVEKKHPEAVKEVGGYKAVNYDLATRDAANKKHMAPGGAVNYSPLPFPALSTGTGRSGSAFPQLSSQGAGQSQSPFAGIGDMYQLGRSIGGQEGLIGSLGNALGDAYFGAGAFGMASGGAVDPDSNDLPSFHLLPFPTAPFSTGPGTSGPGAQQGQGAQSANPLSGIQDMYKLGSSIGGEGGLIGKLGGLIGFEHGGSIRHRAIGGGTELEDSPSFPPSSIQPFLYSANKDADSFNTAPESLPYYETNVQSYAPKSEEQKSPLYTPSNAASMTLPALAGPAPSNELSPETIEFLKARENFNPNPYGDYQQTSIGYGTRAAPGQTSITRDEAERALTSEAGAVNNWINQNVTQPLTPNQRTALVDFGYNLGTGKGGLTDLLPAINKGDWQTAANQMGRYIHAGGQELPGLIARRDMDMNLLTNPNASLPAVSAAPRMAGAVPEERRPDMADTAAHADKIMQRLGYQQAPGSSTGGVLAKIFGKNAFTVDPLGIQGNPLVMAGLGQLAPGTQRGLAMPFTQQENQRQSILNAMRIAETARHNRASESILGRQAKQKSFTRIGTDTYGQPIYGFVDPITGAVTPATKSYSTSTSNDPTLTGEAYLKTIDPKHVNIVKKLANYDIKVPTGAALRSSFWQAVFEETMRYDPSFDAKQYDVRNETVRDYGTRGKSGQNITFINTALGHIGRLYDEAKKLDNWPADSWGLLTSQANSWREWALRHRGDPRVKAFEANKHDAIQMMIKAAKGNASTVHEVEEWEKTISAANSPEALKAAIAKGAALMGDRLDELTNSYNRVMRTQKSSSEFISPHAQKVKDQLEKEQLGIGYYPSSASNENIQKFNSDAEAADAFTSGKLKTGDKFIDKDGNERTVR